jgi:hypothetical protein
VRETTRENDDVAVREPRFLMPHELRPRSQPREGANAILLAIAAGEHDDPDVRLLRHEIVTS